MEALRDDAGVRSLVMGESCCFCEMGRWWANKLEPSLVRFTIIIRMGGVVLRESWGFPQAENELWRVV